MNSCRIFVAYNEDGRRIGETHHNASIPDAIILQIRTRHEKEGIGYRALAKEFGLSPNTTGKLCYYLRRAQQPARWKTIASQDFPLLPRKIKLLSLAGVMQRVPLTMACLKRMCEKGEFPQPYTSSRQEIVWLEHEIDAWIQTRNNTGQNRKDRKAN